MVGVNNAAGDLHPEGTRQGPGSPSTGTGTIAPPQMTDYLTTIGLDMPGTLPVINAEAVRQTVRTGLALNCTIPSFSKFDRKNYHYPDLMKGYQISQYDLPLCVKGHLDVDVPDERGNKRYTRTVGIIRVHLEEDTARLLHRTDPDGNP